MGRLLSLIPFDALIYCTPTGDRSNQSLWMREIQSKLKEDVELNSIAMQLEEFLKTDDVPRTRKAVKRIVKNLFGIEDKLKNPISYDRALLFRG